MVKQDRYGSPRTSKSTAEVFGTSANICPKNLSMPVCVGYPSFQFPPTELVTTKTPFSHSRSEPRPGRCSAYDQNLCFEYDIMQILFIFSR